MRRKFTKTSVVCTMTALAVSVLLSGLQAAAAVPSFNKEVAPILFRNCVKCHRPGEIASLASFLSYETTRPWVKSIKEKVMRREMPPWPADPNASVKFSNDARLRREDIDTLVAWIDAGAPRGNEAGLPPVPQLGQQWLHPKGLPPDLIISMPGEFQVPAQGEIPYIRFLAKLPPSEDRWVVASQLVPSNRAVVHHMAVTEVELAQGLNPADLNMFGNIFAKLSHELGLSSPLSPVQPAVATPDRAVYDVLGVYTPGTTFEMYASKSAKLLKGGTNLYLNFNIHYTTTGKTEHDRSMMGLWFQPGPPEHQVFRAPAAIDTIIVDGDELLTDTPGQKAEGTNFVIPPIRPNEENYEVIGLTAFTQPITIFQFQPHGHIRCKDFEYSVVYPNGREEKLLSIPKYDFNWQLAYDLETPIRLPAGSKLIARAHYDNSPKNKRNPDPQKEVHFREMNQSTDEMFTPFIQYSLDTEDLARPSNTALLQSNPKKVRGALPVVETVGCLTSSSEGRWVLANAGGPMRSNAQSTSSQALRAAQDRAPGDRRYELLGVSFFKPSNTQGRMVAIKGVLISDARVDRLNVTSLQKLGAACVE